MMTISSPLTAGNTPLALTAAIQTLAQHPESERIQKLLYWVYTGRWEGTTANLGPAVLDQILPELVKRTPSYEVLERRIYKAAAVLNKPEKYKQVATIILQACGTLYPSTAIQRSLVQQPQPPSLEMMVEPSAEDALPMTTIAQPDRFELRCRVMQQVPPLKVKILLFSVLRHPFSFEPLDWKELKTQSLDDWLAELMRCFPTLEGLEIALFTQATQLRQLDQSSQIAEAILQAVRFRTS